MTEQRKEIRESHVTYDITISGTGAPNLATHTTSNLLSSTIPNGDLHLVNPVNVSHLNQTRLIEDIVKYPLAGGLDVRNSDLRYSRSPEPAREYQTSAIHNSRVGYII